MARRLLKNLAPRRRRQRHQERRTSPPRSQRRSRPLPSRRTPKAPAPANPPKSPSPSRPRVVAIHKFVFPVNWLLTPNDEVLARIRYATPRSVRRVQQPLLGTNRVRLPAGGARDCRAPPLPGERMPCVHGQVDRAAGLRRGEDGPMSPSQGGTEGHCSSGFKKKDQTLLHGRKSGTAAAQKKGTCLPNGHEVLWLAKRPG
jgi:hypothetical protein